MRRQVIPARPLHARSSSQLGPLFLIVRCAALRIVSHQSPAEGNLARGQGPTAFCFRQDSWLLSLSYQGAAVAKAKSRGCRRLARGKRADVHERAQWGGVPACGIADAPALSWRNDGRSYALGSCLLSYVNDEASCVGRTYPP